MIELLWNGPISQVRMDHYLGAIVLKEDARVLDVGCGAGEVLIRLGERNAIHGVGVDSSAIHIEEAKRRASGRAPRSTLRFVESDIRAHTVESESLDLTLCLGASHAFGHGPDAYHQALSTMLPWVALGGAILIAEGYTKRPAPQEYRALLGDSTPDEQTHAANVATGVALGLTPLGAWTSSDAEWDDFEWGYQRIVEEKAASEPKNSELTERLARRREWMDAYVRWGRDTLGYGAYLFKKSA